MSNNLLDPYRKEINYEFMDGYQATVYTQPDFITLSQQDLFETEYDNVIHTNWGRYQQVNSHPGPPEFNNTFISATDSYKIRKNNPSDDNNRPAVIMWDTLSANGRNLTFFTGDINTLGPVNLIIVYNPEFVEYQPGTIYADRVLDGD